MGKTGSLGPRSRVLVYCSKAPRILFANPNLHSLFDYVCIIFLQIWHHICCILNCFFLSRTVFNASTYVFKDYLFVRDLQFGDFVKFLWFSQKTSAWMNLRHTTCSRHRNLQIFCYDFFAWSKLGRIAPESRNLF